MLGVKCQNCHTELEHPGDYCLTCGQNNAELLGVYFEKNVHIFCFYGGEYVGKEIVKTVTSNKEDELDSQIAHRNTMELVAEALHRKRPEKVITSGVEPQAVLQLWDCEAFYTEDFETAEEFKEALKEYLHERVIEKVDIRPEKKISGKHDTVIGGRYGQKTLREIGHSPYIKKIIPGPIEVSGKSSTGFGFKLQKPDSRGNLKVLLREGATVQEIRLVTTAYDQKTGKKVIDELANRLNK